MSIAYDDQMSAAEGLMWRLEADPHLSSTFATVSFLDRAPDMARFRQNLVRASLVMPRLRQVVRTSPGNLTAPKWVSDADFDIEHHVRQLTLPSNGDERMVLDLASELTATPFDRHRPLWEFIVVEGLPKGRAALIQKLHHTIADGESGIRLSLEYLDFEPDAPARPLPDPDTVESAVENAVDATPDPGPAPAPDRVTAVARDFLNGALKLPIGVAQQVRDLLADPSTIPDATAEATATMRSIMGQLGDTDPARSPLWTERSTRRHLEIASVPFRETKAAAKVLGGTLNSAFMTIVTDATSRYHIELGAPVDELRASMAISTRTADSGANAFSLVRMLVPTNEMPIDERFRSIQAATDAAMQSSSGASLDRMAAFATALPTPVVSRLARQQAQTVDFATSNVKGSPVPMFVAGAQLLANHPIGPLSGVACNLTLLSYLGRLDMGLNTDAAAVTEPEMLARFIGESADDLLSVGS